MFYPKPPPPGKTAADAAMTARRKRQQAQDALLNATSGERTEHQKRKSKNNNKKLGERDDAFEIIFEAHAPKIIIPEDSTTEQGYLLMDTGYLEVRGFVGQAGMSWDLSLKDVNAGMPINIRDMYSLEQNESLYLVKPFDIDCVIQNVDKSIADMTVDLEIKPEFRGELNAKKLDRLMFCLGIAQETMFQPPEELPEMEALKELDVTFTGSSKYMHMLPRPTSISSLNKAALSTEDDSTKTKSTTTTTNSHTFQNSQKGSAGITGIEEEEENPFEIKRLITQYDRQKAAETDTRDPEHVGLCLTIRMPVLALDLSYDNDNDSDNDNKHLVLEIKSLDMRLINRPNDVQIEFSLSALSIQDSNRCESQRYLASTPKDSPTLIQIKYINIQNRKSPLYINHGMQLIVNFANLHLNLDVNTLMHLRPFIIVLLHRNVNPDQVRIQQEVMIAAQAEANGQENLSMTEKPIGSHMILSMENIRLDILRVAEEEKDRVFGGLLDPAFSLAIIGMHADLDNRFLMKSVVTLQSVEVCECGLVMFMFRGLFLYTVVVTLYI
mgnify:CR=1 FL=1